MVATGKDKTISELSKEIGVSKPTISKAIAELGIEPQKIGNRFLLNETQISQIKSKILQTPQEETEKIPQKSEDKSENLEKMITILQNQMEVLSNQLIEKDKQIAQLTTALENATAATAAAQALHVADKKMLMDTAGEEDTVIEDKPAEKLSLWQRLTGKKGG